MLFARDSARFARRWPGKLLVAAVLIVIPASMVLLSVSGDRYGRYADDSWKALLMLVVLAVGYLVTRRLLVTVLVGAVTVAVASWGLAPDLSDARNGDPTVLAHLDQRAGWACSPASTRSRSPRSTWTRHHGAAGRHRRRRHHADGARIHDQGDDRSGHRGRRAARRDPDGRRRLHLSPAAEGVPAGTATMQELVTHTAGYAEFGAATLRRAAWKAPLGQDFLTADSTQMTEETRGQTLTVAATTPTPPSGQRSRGRPWRRQRT